jgi:hypothetical protein
MNRSAFTVVMCFLHLAGFSAFAQTNTTVSIRPDAVLATVNNRNVTLRDLMPLPASQTERETVSRDSLTNLLQRAIEREVIHQVANSLGVSLTSEQQQDLEKVRQAVQRREGGDPNVVHLNLKGSLDERVAFEVREARAMMLRDNLVARIASERPHVTRQQVLNYYQAHASEYPPLPTDPVARDAALRQIYLQIRRQLAPQIRAAYEQRVREYLQQIRSSATISIRNP